MRVRIADVMMTTQRRTATAFVNRTFTNATPARNTTLIRVHARIVPKMRTAAVLTRAGTPTATAGVESFVRTGNTGTDQSVFPRSVHAKHLPIASAGTIVLTIPADRDVKRMMIAETEAIAKTTPAFQVAELTAIVLTKTFVLMEFAKIFVKIKNRVRIRNIRNAG